MRTEVTRILSLKSYDEIAASLVQLANKQQKIEDRQTLSGFLASYQERLGKFDEAVLTYTSAAALLPGTSSDLLSLDAARCYLMMNDTQAAADIVNKVLLSGLDPAVQGRARAYGLWIRIVSSDREQSLSLIRSLTQDVSFEDYAPALLFGLWWAEHNGEARDLLLSTWPLSPEAAIVRGEVAVSPQSFWFLMDRQSVNQSRVENTVQESVSVPEPVQKESVPIESTPSDKDVLWQQVGFFRNKDYADELARRLHALGLSPLIRSERRPSGTEYFVVLVSEDNNFTTAAKLKNAGYESFLVID